MKLVYLVQLKISEKWTRPIHNWGLAVNQLSVHFGDRIRGPAGPQAPVKTLTQLVEHFHLIEPVWV